MRVEGRVFQAALKSYGQEPGALDGIIGPATISAIQAFDLWVRGSEGGSDVWGDYAITPSADARSVNITPDSAARRFQTRGTQYLAENPGEIVFPRERRVPRASASAGGSLDTGLPPAPLALPFFRSSNPWLWLLVGLGFISLGAGAFYVARRMRRR